MAFIDANGDGKWNAGEWLGYSENITEDIQIGSADIRIALTDKPTGYIRFSWEQDMAAIAAAVSHVPGTTYKVSVKALSQAGQPIIYSATRDLESMARPFVTEMDFIQAGIDPLNGSYQWVVAAADTTPFVVGTNTVSYPIGLATPQISNLGTVLHARERIRIKLDPNAAQIQVQIQNIASGQTVLNTNLYRPYVDVQGWAEMDLPILAGFGAFANGQYRIQVRAFNPRTSATSSWVDFAVDLKGPDCGGAAMITGKAFYYGWELNPRIVVEAYSGSGTLAKTLAVSDGPNRWKYALMGVKNGDCHVRAFHDRNNNGIRDAGENWGILKGSRDDPTAATPTLYTVDFLEKRIEIRNQANFAGNDLVIYDADTDNDGIVDSYEYRFAGNLSKMNGQSNMSGDNWRDIDNFKAGQDPTQTYASVPQPCLIVGPLSKTGTKLLLAYEVTGRMPKVVVVQSSTNMASGVWKEEFRSTVTQSGIYTNVVPAVSGSGMNKFFRIRFVD